MYKVAQWATGSVGMWSLREIIRHPDLELVGLRVYSPDKVGQDAGTLVGGPPVGVVGTDSTEEILASGADIVVHCAKAFGELGQMADDVVTLLEAGINVVSVCDYMAPDLQGPEMFARLDEAGKRGGATLHGTGIDPGFLCDRLPATLTALSTEVDHIEMIEVADLSGHPNPSMIMDLLGFGLKPEDFRIDPSNPGLQYCAIVFPQAIRTLFKQLDVEWGRLQIAPPELVTATKDLDLPSGKIAKGTTAGINWRFEGYRPDDPDGQPFATHQWSWYIEPGLPGMPEADGHYQIHLNIEGTPSLRTVVDITHPEDPFFMPTAGAAIRAIPEVVAAPPGHFTAPVFGGWSPRLRR